MRDSTEQFRQAISASGLEPPSEIEPNKLHRFPGIGKRNGNTAGWCKLFADCTGGVFGDWAQDFSDSWQAKREKPFTESERKAFKDKCEWEKQARQAERDRQHAEARKLAQKIWREAKPETGRHRYLRDKDIDAYGIRCTADRLLIPLRSTDGTLHSLQYIDPRGEKLFLKDARVVGCYHAIGKPKNTLCICEGYATGATIHKATGHAVAVAFNAGNVTPVALALREKLPSVSLILCADNDIEADKRNTGIGEATKAATAVDGLLAVPELSGDKCDFNDLARFQGLEAVKACVENAKALVKDEVESKPESSPAGAVGAEEWPKPLIVQTDPSPYPLDALPGGIGAAVREVVDFVQCPAALAACSALSAASVTCQGLADVRRAEKLSGPCGLYLLAVADSGERKTSCDGFFTSSIREWERQQAERLAPELAKYAAKMQAWTAKREGVLQAIKTAAKSGKSTSQKEDELEDLEADRPQAPRVPSLIYGDTTPEALAFYLAQAWPSGGVLSSEAGIVFGGHAMGRDSITRNLALLNSLWDGRGHKVHRRTADPFTVDGVRLTMGLAVQPETIRAFFENSRGLARGSGFAARFLIAWPRSTQGNRQFRSAPVAWPHLSAFHNRITALLDQVLTINDSGALDLPMLDLSREATSAWIHFHDEVERELKPGGDMAETRDVASKAADNVARLAALFHVYEFGAMGEISAERVNAAARIVAWHLYEARRFLSELVTPRAISHAAKLDAWLLQYCRETGSASVTTRHVQQYGPGALREKQTLEEAVNELMDASRVRLVSAGRRKEIQVNPSLLEKS